MKKHLLLLLILINACPLQAADNELERLKTDNKELRQIIEKLTQRITELEAEMQIVKNLLDIDEPDIRTPDSSNRVTIHSKGKWKVEYTPERRQVGLHRYEIAEIKGYLKNITIKVWHTNFDQQAWSTEGQEYHLTTPDGKILQGDVGRPIVVLYKLQGWHTVKFTSEVPLYTGEYEFVISPADSKTIRERAPFTLKFTPENK